MSDDEKITVLWCGEPREATVVKRFKNGKVRVQIGVARWTGGRPGTLSDAPRITVEPWQIAKDEMLSATDHENADRVLNALQGSEVRGSVASTVGRRAGVTTVAARHLLNVLVDEGRAHRVGDRYWPGHPTPRPAVVSRKHP